MILGLYILCPPFVRFSIFEIYIAYIQNKGIQNNKKLLPVGSQITIPKYLPNKIILKVINWALIALYKIIKKLWVLINEYNKDRERKYYKLW